MTNTTITRMNEAQHTAVSVLRSHCVPHMTHQWEDYETAKHYIGLQEWPDRTQYAQALKVACEWVGV